MTPDTTQALHDLLAITQTSQITPVLVQQLQTAARALLAVPSTDTPCNSPVVSHPPVSKRP